MDLFYVPLNEALDLGIVALLVGVLTSLALFNRRETLYLLAEIFFLRAKILWYQLKASFLRSDRLYTLYREARFLRLRVINLWLRLEVRLFNRIMHGEEYPESKSAKQICWIADRVYLTFGGLNESIPGRGKQRFEEVRSEFLKVMAEGEARCVVVDVEECFNLALRRAYGTDRYRYNPKDSLLWHRPLTPTASDATPTLDCIIGSGGPGGHECLNVALNQLDVLLRDVAGLPSYLRLCLFQLLYPPFYPSGYVLFPGQRQFEGAPLAQRAQHDAEALRQKVLDAIHAQNRHRLTSGTIPRFFMTASSSQKARSPAIRRHHPRRRISFPVSTDISELPKKLNSCAGVCDLGRAHHIRLSVHIIEKTTSRCSGPEM
ncbi:hypothetical protein DL770_009662 [Monosporascus sp. CRB-9-2]|nr:hypothetical protein DL770_009662 [Monosporascus sp. CRB-9-2]